MRSNGVSGRSSSIRQGPETRAPRRPARVGELGARAAMESRPRETVTLTQAGQLADAIHTSMHGCYEPLRPLRSF
jgi:hypothetical protein